MTADFRDKQPQKRNLLRTSTFWVATIAVASLVVGLLGVALTYIALKEPDPRVTFETIGDTNVLDLRRPLHDLSILFRGQNIQEQNLNLRIMTINVVNSGAVNILPSHYDPDDAWGMRFRDSEVIEARLVDTSSEYLRSKVVPQRLGVDTISFPKVIFEKDAFFAVEVLLLHPKDASPIISSVGKIAGIDNINVLTRSLAREEVSFVANLFEGSAPVQLTRAIIYLVGWLVAIVAGIFALVGISDFFGRLKARRRRSRILRTRTILEIEQDEVRNLLVARFESRGTAGLKGLQELTKEPGRIDWITPQPRWIARDYQHFRDWSTASRVIDMESMLIGLPDELETLVTMGILKRGEDDNAVIDPTFVQAIDNLLSELEK